VVHLFWETGSIFGKLDRFLLLQQWEHLFCGLFVIPKTSKIIGPQLPVEVVRIAATRTTSLTFKRHRLQKSVAFLTSHSPDFSADAFPAALPAAPAWPVPPAHSAVLCRTP
jgi:hypothetical protein